MTTTENHAGAEERATRCVSWWIGGNYNDGEATCRHWKEMVTTAYEALDPDDRKANDPATYDLAQELKDWCEDERGDVHGTPFDDMLSYMLACVDWQQLALDAITEEIRHQQS